MATQKPRTVLYRRKRELKTRYSKRLKLLLSGKKRVVVRLTNTRVIAQLVEFTPKGDKVLLGVDSSALKQFGWTYSAKSIPAAYLTGLSLGVKAKEKKINEEVVLDTGLRSPLHKGRTYAFLKGAVDAGLKVPHENKTSSLMIRDCRECIYKIMQNHRKAKKPLSLRNI
ncbi:MAG: 50S ribosomal protein L18 [Nanoarchaeota archaeon]